MILASREDRAWNLSEQEYADLSPEEKMIRRLEAAASIIAFVGGTIVPPGKEPLDLLNLPDSEPVSLDDEGKEVLSSGASA
ncbi:MAG: hypothetical protein AAF556_02625 [Pseudomonadota bacterium]